MNFVIIFLLIYSSLIINEVLADNPPENNSITGYVVYKSKVNGSIWFSCPVNNSERKIELEWRQNNTIVDPVVDQRYKIEHMTLKIRNLTLSDTGIYTCKVNGNSNNYTADLIVRRIPHATKAVVSPLNDSCANISWTYSTRDDEEPISNFIVQYRTDLDSPDNWTAVNVSRSSYSYPVPLQVWANHTFKVTAVNILGNASSDPVVWPVPQNVPFKNPDNVTIPRTASNGLVISWNPLSREQHNAPDFYYEIGWKKINETGWQKKNITNWEQTNDTIQDVTDYQEYNVIVQSGNKLGLCTTAPEVKTGYSGKYVNTTIDSSYSDNKYKSKVGGSFLFPCNAKTDISQRPSHKWYVNETEINSGRPRFVFNDALNSLNISNLDTTDSGTYKCTVTTSLDNATASVLLIVREPPPAPLADKLCNRDNASINWTYPNMDVEEEIFNFTLQYKTDLYPEKWNESIVISPWSNSSYERKVQTPVWVNYTFRVLAENFFGISAPSTELVCSGPYKIPKKNPDNVTICGTTSGSLVISWTRMSEEEFNAPGFYYEISWKRILPETDWQSSITNSSVGQYGVTGVPDFEKYSVKVRAGNKLGLCTTLPNEVKGYSGKYEGPCAINNYDCQCSNDTMNCIHLRLPYMPININETIIKLNLSGNSLNKSLTETTFFDYGRIQLLDLSKNHIEKLPNSSVFKYLQNLTQLRLNHNNIHELDNQIFQGLDKLKELDLSENSIEKLPNSVFKYLQNLTQLYLQHNNIVELNNQIFQGLDKLKKLNLQFNKITKVISHAFKNLNQLVVLSMQNNQINTLEQFSFGGLKLLEELYLSNNLIETIPGCMFQDLGNLCDPNSQHSITNDTKKQIIFNQTSLRILDLDNNHIKKLTPFLFEDLPRLEKLHLQENKIDEVQDFSFNGLIQLRELNLSHNQIETLPSCLFQISRKSCSTEAHHIISDIEKLKDDTFVILPSLEILDLNNNKMREIIRREFAGLNQLKDLNLGENLIEKIENGGFGELKNLTSLDLSTNQITKLEKGTVEGLDNVQILNLKNNDIQEFPEGLFGNMTNLSNLDTTTTGFCCVIGKETICKGPEFFFSSCEHLTGNNIIRIFIWILGIIAVFNNIYVVAHQTFSKADKNKVDSFLIKNLALSDIFMGVYLLIIAYAELSFAGKYYLNDRKWREGFLCNFAGFLAVFSSELTVFTLTVISLNRLFAFKFPFRKRQKKITKTIHLLMIAGWIVALTIAIIPLPLFHINYFKNQFYGRSGVCLPFHLTDEKAPGWEYSAVIFILINAISFIIIAYSYIEIYRIFRESSSNVKSHNQASSSTMTLRMAFIISADAACWIPIIGLGIGSLCRYSLSNEVYAWVAQFILPLNASLNPIIYTLLPLFIKYYRQKASKKYKASNTKKTQLNYQSLPLTECKPGLNAKSASQSPLPSTNKETISVKSAGQDDESSTSNEDVALVPNNIPRPVYGYPKVEKEELLRVLHRIRGPKSDDNSE